MGQKELSLLLRAVVALLAVFLACAIIFFLPPLTREVELFCLDRGMSELLASTLGGCAFPAVIALSAVPCFAALWLAFAIFTEIGKNNSFCDKNAKRLCAISHLALLDTAVYILLAVALCLLGMGHPSVVLVLGAVVLFGISMTVACAALSHLTQKAADLKTDSDLTI